MLSPQSGKGQQWQCGQAWMWKYSLVAAEAGALQIGCCLCWLPCSRGSRCPTHFMCTPIMLMTVSQPNNRTQNEPHQHTWKVMSRSLFASSLRRGFSLMRRLSGLWRNISRLVLPVFSKAAPICRAGGAGGAIQQIQGQKLGQLLSCAVPRLGSHAR